MPQGFPAGGATELSQNGNASDRRRNRHVKRTVEYKPAKPSLLRVHTICCTRCNCCILLSIFHIVLSCVRQ